LLARHSQISSDAIIRTAAIAKSVVIPFDDRQNSCARLLLALAQSAQGAGGGGAFEAYSPQGWGKSQGPQSRPEILGGLRVPEGGARVQIDWRGVTVGEFGRGRWGTSEANAHHKLQVQAGPTDPNPLKRTSNQGHAGTHTAGGFL
jgi:hypothetical protein